jgi:hypothetical protein
MRNLFVNYTAGIGPTKLSEACERLVLRSPGVVDEKKIGGLRQVEVGSRAEADELAKGLAGLGAERVEIF